MMRQRVAIGLAAAFGGVFPNLFRLGTEMTQGQPLPEISYLLGVAIFGVMGAGTAIALGEAEARKAFFLGLGLPAMFQSATTDLTVAPLTASLAPAVYAREFEEEPDRLVLLFFRDAPPAGVEIEYRVKGSRLIATDPVKIGKDGVAKIAAPGRASAVRLELGDSESAWFDLPAGHELGAFNVTIRRKPWSGVKQAIGVRGAALYTIELEEVDHGNR